MGKGSGLLVRAAFLLVATVDSVFAAELDSPVARAQQHGCGSTSDRFATTLLPGAADCQADGQASALLQAVGGLSVAVQEVTPAGPEMASKGDSDHILLPQSGYHQIVTSVDAPLPSGVAHHLKKPISATQEEPETHAGASDVPETTGAAAESSTIAEPTTGATAESSTVAEPTTSNGTESSNATAAPANGLPSPFIFDSFNCTAGLSRWKTGWSSQKKAWCCKNSNVGCSFNCVAGLSRWRKGWSDAKKDWCCKNKGFGCKFNCSAGALRWKRGWSQMKKDWCCKNRNFGCEGKAAVDTTTTVTSGVTTRIPATPMTTSTSPTTKTVITTTTTTTPFDCQSGLLRAAVGWSKEKRAWCCKDQRVGCIDGEEVVFDCSQGTKKWETGWSAKKKEFCCRTSRVGCEVGTADSAEGLKEDIQEGEEKGEGATTEGKSHGGEEGTEGEAGSKEEVQEEEDKLFNCSAGVLHWKEGWSETKKAYCCNAEGVGCTGSRTKPCVTTYDPMVSSSLRYSAAKPGSPCIFNADPRDEGWHCILDGMMYGTFGWCWTDLQRTTYGACSQDCPLFSQQKVLGDRMKRMEQKLDRLLNASGVNISDIPDADSPLPSAPERKAAKGGVQHEEAPPPSAEDPAEVGHGHGH